MNQTNDECENVLNFWFNPEVQPFWYRKDENFDNIIREKFKSLHERAINGDLEGWKQTPKGTMAFIILIDQFSRNMFRDMPEAFAYDRLAVEACKHGIQQGFDNQLNCNISFFYMPLMHSEDIEDQNMCLDLFTALAKALPDQYELSRDFAKKHQVIVERFGRFPHRNQILGRQSTQEEIEFLKEPNSSF